MRAWPSCPRVRRRFPISSAPDPVRALVSQRKATAQVVALRGRQRHFRRYELSWRGRAAGALDRRGAPHAPNSSVASFANSATPSAPGPFRHRDHWPWIVADSAQRIGQHRARRQSRSTAPTPASSFIASAQRWPLPFRDTDARCPIHRVGGARCSTVLASITRYTARPGRSIAACTTAPTRTPLAPPVPRENASARSPLFHRAPVRRP